MIERLRERPITLLEEFSDITAEDLEARFPDGRPIVVCDFGVTGIEAGEEIPGGYRHGRILSIDHHVPNERMARRISSTTLAIEQARSDEGFPEDSNVVIHHTDCDSILSSLIARGFLPPEDRFNDAAIAADHTGEENDISDLLGSLMQRRDLEFSMRNLEALLHGAPLDSDALKALEQRKSEREEAAKLVASEALRKTGNVYYVWTKSRPDAALFPALLPDAAVVIVGSPMKHDSGKSVIKIRLGMKAPEGFMLNTLDLPDFGGRWNAGNTKRHGGTAIPIEEYAELVREKLESWESPARTE